eukprot:1476238-Rhodomonas_salina.1
MHGVRAVGVQRRTSAHYRLIDVCCTRWRWSRRAHTRCARTCTLTHTRCAQVCTYMYTNAYTVCSGDGASGHSEGPKRRRQGGPS